MRWRPKFSLRTLAVFTLLCTSGFGLWWHWDAVYLEASLHEAELWMIPEAFSLDGSRLVVSCDNDTAIVWDIAREEKLAVLSGHEAKLNWAAFSPDGQRVATASDDRTARVWRLADQAQLSVLRGHEAWVRSAVFLPDGRRVLTASNDKTCAVWDSLTGERLLHMKGHEHIVLGAALSSDGELALSWGWDDTARIWDTGTGKCLQVLQGHKGWTISGCFSDDSSRATTASQDGTARIWDTESGDCLAVLRGGGNFVRSASFSPDGRRVVTAGGSYNYHGHRPRADYARVWDVDSGTLLTTMEGHEWVVEYAAFTADGRAVLTTSDQTVGVWDASNGQLLRLLKEDGSHIAPSVFSPDRSRIAMSGEGPGTVMIFRRRRPEWWWGVAWLPEFWLTVVFAGLFVWSVVRDRRSLRKKGEPTE